MSKPEDDFPPTQAVEPPPEIPDPPPRDARAITHPPGVYEGVEQQLPARTWKENPLLWIALVVAMFMAVPLLASMATRGKPAPPKPRAEAPASVPAEAVPAHAEVVPVAAPVAAPDKPVATPVPGNVKDLPPNLRPQADTSRQMITKCYENGRVVYTQTGKCTGSMSAVPIDTGKNVVGPGNAAVAPGNAAPAAPVNSTR
jgi:hypothetical protein